MEALMVIAALGALVLAVLAILMPVFVLGIYNSALRQESVARQILAEIRAIERHTAPATEDPAAQRERQRRELERLHRSAFTGRLVSPASRDGNAVT